MSNTYADVYTWFAIKRFDGELTIPVQATDNLDDFHAPFDGKKWPTIFI